MVMAMARSGMRVGTGFQMRKPIRSIWVTSLKSRTEGVMGPGQKSMAPISRAFLPSGPWGVEPDDLQCPCLF